MAYLYASRAPWRWVFEESLQSDFSQVGSVTSLPSRKSVSKGVMKVRGNEKHNIVIDHTMLTRR
jgi:hypothetical protein